MSYADADDRMDNRSMNRRRLVRALAGLGAGASAAALWGTRPAAAKKRKKGKDDTGSTGAGENGNPGQDDTGANGSGEDANSTTPGGANTGESQTNGPVRGTRVRRVVRGEVVVGTDGADG